jgi:hypothetical protein
MHTLEYSGGNALVYFQQGCVIRPAQRHFTKIAYHVGLFGVDGNQVPVFVEVESFLRLNMPNPIDCFPPMVFVEFSNPAGWLM